MIASRKRMNDSSKSSITRLISYLTNTQGSSQRVGEVRISGCEAEEAGWAAMEMLATQQQNTRAKGDKTYHLVLSFHENLPSRDIAEIERRVCEAIGLGEHQRVSVMHNDTENPHLHIAINKIHPQKLTMIEPYYDEKTLARVCVQLEKEFGLVADNHEPRAQGRSSAATSMERAGDMESLTGWIQRNCLSALKEAKDWRAFGKVLAEHGLSLEERKNGFVLTDGKVHVKASSVAYGLSRARLEKRLGNFEGLEQRESEPKKRYVRQPMSGSTSLWMTYLREEDERRNKLGRIQREMSRRVTRKDERQIDSTSAVAREGVPLSVWIRRNCLSALKEAEDWQSFDKVLARHGLSLKPRGNGFVITDGKERVKASEVDRGLSRASLEKRLGVLEGAEAKKRDARERLESSLWDAWRREEAEKRNEQAEERMEQREEAFQDFDLRNVLIKYMTSGTFKRVLYDMSRSRLKEDLKKKQWIDWLRSKAGEKQSSRDSSGALTYLRSRCERSNVEMGMGYLAGVERQPSSMAPDNVTRKGSRMFGNIRERDSRLLIPANATQNELNELLDFAEQHFSRFSINGPEPLRERVLELSASREQARNLSREQSRGYSR